MNSKIILIVFFSALINAWGGKIVIRLKPDEALSKDTYVRSPGYGYATSSTLRASYRASGSSYIREIFLAFPGMNLLPVSPRNVTLWMWLEDSTTYSYNTTRVNFYLPRASWSESVRWDTKPSSTYWAYGTIQENYAEDWIGYNLESIYETLRSSGRGVRITAGYKESFEVTSSSSSDWHYRPELAVEFDFPALVYPVAKKVGSSWVKDNFDWTKINSYGSGGAFGDHWENSYAVDGNTRLLHTGIDLHASAGTPIYAMHKGTIYNLTNAGSDGYFMSIRYPLGGNYYVTSTYHHTIPEVSNGASVDANQRVATVYNLATGPHLHVQIRFGDDKEPDSGYNIVPIGRLPEKKMDTPKRTGGTTGVLPAFPDFFIDPEYDVNWVTQ